MQIKTRYHYTPIAAAAAVKSLQSCPTLCDPTDRSPPGSPVSGILQARTLEWAAISFSNTWKWKVKVKSLSCVWLSATPWTAAHQAHPSMEFSRQEYWSGVPMPFRRAQIQNWWHQMLARVWNNRNSCLLTAGMQNGTATLEESLAISYNSKHALLHTIQQSHSLIFTQRSWKLMSIWKLTHGCLKQLYS